jgi:hypothetical protein
VETIAVAASEPVTDQATCRGAIALTWPAELQAQALTVLEHENRRENPQAVGAVNNNGSVDYGCFQINDIAHPQFFATKDWRDPIANATEAYLIYKGRQALTGNGWQAWYAVHGILW